MAKKGRKAKRTAKEAKGKPEKKTEKRIKRTDEIDEIKTDETRFEFYASVFIAVLSVLTTAYYIAMNNMPLSWDPALHMLYSYLYYRLITSFNFGQIVHVSNYYPPFFSLTSAFMYILFGFSEKTGIATNIVYYFILIYSIYGISSTLWDRRAGYLSVIIISAYPFLLTLQREFMLDFALTAMVALTAYFFLKSNYLRDLKYSALFGLSLGLATLTKWDAFLYILPFVLAEMYFEYGFNFNRLKETSGCVIVALLIAFISSSWWYLPNMGVVTRRLVYFANIGGKEGNPPFWTLNGWLYYLKSLDFSMGLIFTVIFFAGIAWMAYRKKLSRHEYSMLFAVLTIYVVLTFLSNKDNRYILPALPYIAMLTGAFVSDVVRTYGLKAGKANLSKIVTCLIVLLSAVQICSATFAVPDFHNPYIMISSKPQSQNWHINDILKTIAKYAKPGDVVITLADHPYLNGQSLEFYRVVRGYTFRIFNGPYLPVNYVIKNFNRINFVIVIKPRVHKGVYGRAEAELYSAFNKYRSDFRLIGKYPLPDGTYVYIYMNKKYH